MPGRHRKRGRRGEGHVELLPDGRYRIRLSFKRSDGTREQPYAYGRSEAEAKGQADAIRRRWGAQLLPVGTIGELTREWIDRHRDIWAPNTVLLRQTYIRTKVEPILGAVPISQFTRGHFARFTGTITQDGTPPSAAYAAQVALRSALRWGVSEGIFPTDPIALARIEAPRRAQREPFDIPESERLLREAKRSSRFYALYLLALMGPLRQGECFALTFGDLDFKRSLVHVRATLSDTPSGEIIRKHPKTSKSYRTLSMPPLVMQALAELPQGASGDYVFADERGGPQRRSNFDRREYHPLLVRARLRRQVFHTLRYSSVSIMAAKGTPLPVIQKRGGWSSPRTILDIYLQALRGDDEATAQMFGNLFSSL